MSEELKFRQFGKTKGIIIEDGTKKGFGSLIPLPNKDQAGNKYQLKVNNPKGIPTSVLNEKQNELLKKGVINKAQRKFVDKVDRKGSKSIRVKNVAEGKKLANKLSKMFKVGGGSDFPIKLQQGPDLIRKNKSKTKK
jgi:hypothetical protein